MFGTIAAVVSAIASAAAGVAAKKRQNDASDQNMADVSSPSPLETGMSSLAQISNIASLGAGLVNGAKVKLPKLVK